MLYGPRRRGRARDMQQSRERQLASVASSAF